MKQERIQDSQEQDLTYNEIKDMTYKNKMQLLQEFNKAIASGLDKSQLQGRLIKKILCFNSNNYMLINDQTGLFEKKKIPKFEIDFFKRRGDEKDIGKLVRDKIKNYDMFQNQILSPFKKVNQEQLKKKLQQFSRQEKLRVTLMKDGRLFELIGQTKDKRVKNDIIFIKGSEYYEIAFLYWNYMRQNQPKSQISQKQNREIDSDENREIPQSQKNIEKNQKEYIPQNEQKIQFDTLKSKKTTSKQVCMLLTVTIILLASIFWTCFTSRWVFLRQK